MEGKPDPFDDGDPRIERGYDDAAADAELAAAVARLREVARRDGAVQADRLRMVARVAALAEAAARRQLAAGPRVSGQPDDLIVIDTAVTSEVMTALGIAERPAGDLLDLARRLTGALPDVLDALEHGRLDLGRVRVLAEATATCPDRVARQVAARLLAGLGSDGPWGPHTPSPRAWRARVCRAVVAADPQAARRRREEAIVERTVRCWLAGDGTGRLWLRAADVDIQLADQVITALALAWPSVDPHGQPLTMDQRRVDALLDVFRRLRDGAPLPAHGLRREREIGLVLHTDTLVGDGPAAADPGELRGLGAPAPLDPHTARDLARAELARGATTCVLLTDPNGTLHQVVPLPAPPESGWTRESLTAAVRAALPDQPPLRTDRYTPTGAIVEHVRARNPHCTAQDCARAARRCDLDHDQPWPRGPTQVENLAPRCRRHHQLKTSGLVTTHLHPDGTVDTRMLSGLLVTTRPAPLPGHGPGEGYARTAT
ncbi:MAG: hypothetical protein QOE40_376 [Actinomycetota bacterium]|nr:hypothetical protein [Actinomycetota bacterium]